MPRDTSTDTITLDLIVAFTRVVANVSGWGQLAALSPGLVAPIRIPGPAVYPGLTLPMPTEGPWPCCYVYMAGQTHDYGQGTGLRRDTFTVTARILGGPATPQNAINPELSVYQMLTGVINELTYRRFLEDPTNNDAPFRSGQTGQIDPQLKVTVGATPRIQTFSYGERGNFVGVDIPATVMIPINIGRLS